MAAKQMMFPANRVFTNSNRAAPGATASLYLSGGLTPANFYSDSGLSVSIGSTITANALGVFPTAYGDESIPYRIIVKDSTGAELDGGDIDPFYFGKVNGADGATASVLVNSITTGAPGSAPSVANSGTAQNVKLDFTLPTTPTITVNSTTTGPAGGNAAVVNSGTSSAIALDFTLPTGTQGPAGDLAKAADRTALAAIAGPTAKMTRFLAEAGREGTFVFDSANNATNVTNDPQQGIYVAPASDTTGASGAWVRKYVGPVDPRWWGLVVGDAAGANRPTNDTAISAMFTTLLAIGTTITISAIPEVRWPFGIIEHSQAITPNATVKMSGHGSGHINGAIGTGALVAGTIFKPYNCSGFNLAYTRSSLSDVGIQGNFSGTEAEYHGVAFTQMVYLTNVKSYNMAGDGFNADGQTGAGHLPDSSRLVGCEAWACRDGTSFGITGGNGDANVIHVIGGIFNFNRRWMHNDHSFLGNSYLSTEGASNGVTSWNDGVTGGASVVIYSGRTYFAIAGQEVAASTNAPSGTSADNTWWAYKGGSGSDVPSTGRPAWSSGMLVRAGGSVHTDTVTGYHGFNDCYSESNQGLAQVSYPTIIRGGILGNSVWKGSSATVVSAGGSASAPFLKINNGVRTTGYSGTDEAVSIGFGEVSSTSKTALYINGATTFPNTARLAKISGGDLIEDYGNAASQVWRVATGPTTTFQFGTGAAFPYGNYFPALFVGQNAINSANAANARRVMIDSAAPSTGAHAAGEICFNRAPSNGGVLCWVCSTAGTPGTWVAVYANGLPQYTVATLPAGVVGQRAFVTDATAATFGSAPTGGGSVKVPVYYDGAWKMG